MKVYGRKSDALADIKRRFPRGAEVGTQFIYVIRTPDGNTQREVEFSVVAEQVWDRGDVRRVMGLVWGSRCEACDAPFFQLSVTHPEDLKEHCSFCASERHETHNYVDPDVFGVPRQRLGTKRRGRMELHVLDIKDTFDEDIIEAEALIKAAVNTLPEPEEGKRDVRRQTVLRAINSLSRERNGPLRISGSKVIFFE